MGGGASTASSVDKYSAGAAATAAAAEKEAEKRRDEQLLPPAKKPPPRRTERIKKRLHRLADPELSSSEDEEELNSPILYLHDTRIPVGAQNLVDWLDCQQVEFQLNTIERHAAAKDSVILIERVALNSAKLPPWYLELEDSALDKHVEDTSADGRCPPRSLPMLKRGRRLYRGQRAVSDLLAELFPAIEMEAEHGITHGFVQRFKDFMALTIDLIQDACKTKVKPPSWGGPQMDAISRGRGTDLQALVQKEHAFQKELQYIEAKLRFGDGPYIDGKVLHSVDWALGPRLQTALLAVRHFTGWDLTVPPFLAINRYRASLLRNPAFPRLLYLNPKLMVAYHQKTRDDLVRQKTKDSLAASGLDRFKLYLAKTPNMLTGRGKATRRLRAGTLSLLFGSDQARFHFALKELPYEAPTYTASVDSINDSDGTGTGVDTSASAKEVEDVLALEPPPDNWLLSVDVVEVSESEAGATDDELGVATELEQAEATELEPAETGGFLAQAVNFIEDKTGLDIDGDGDVGVLGSSKHRSTFLRDVPSGELPAIVHGPRVVCGAKAISSYLEEALNKPNLTPDLKQAWQGKKGGLRPKAVGELFPAAIRYMYTPRTEFRLAEAARTQFEAQLIELEACLLASGGPYLYGPLITVDDCELGPQLQSALVALQHIKGWTLKEKDSSNISSPANSADSTPHDEHEKWRSFPAIRRYRNAIIKHPKFPRRSTEEILALHESSIDTFVAAQLERARVCEDELINRIQYAMFGPRMRWQVSVTVVSCRNLVKADFVGKNDPYVKVTVGETTKQTSTLTDAGADPVWGLDGWNERDTENFQALCDPTMKPKLLENSRGETMHFVVAFPVPTDCTFECMDEDYGSLNPDDLLGRAEIKLGSRDQGGGNIDQWTTQTWLQIQDDHGRPAGELYVRIAVHETTLEALKEGSAVAALPSSSPQAEEWDHECVEHLSRFVDANDRTESATRKFGSIPRMLEGLGRLLDLPVEHPSGWGWDARSFTNMLHDRTAFQSVQRMIVRPGDSVLMVGAGLCSATLQLARRLYSDLTSMSNEGGATLCVTDPCKLRLRDTQRCLSVLHSPAAPVNTTLIASQPNWVEAQHPDGRPVRFPETMPMDEDVMELSHKELQIVAEQMGLLIDPNATMVEIQQEIMRWRRKNTWGPGADAHSHLPFMAAAFHALIVHPARMHLRSWKMSEFLRVLRPGATASIPVRPWHNDIERVSDRAPGVPVLHSVADVCKELRNAGFTRVASETVPTAADAVVQGVFSCTVGSSDAILMSRANAARALQKCCARVSTSVKTHMVMEAGDLDALTPAAQTLIFSSYRWIDEDSKHRGYFALDIPSGGDMDNVHFADSLHSRCPNAQLIIVNACYSADICTKLRSAFAGRISTIGWSSAVLDTEATKFEVALFLELELFNGFSRVDNKSLQIALERAYATLKHDVQRAHSLPQPSWHFAVEPGSAAAVPAGDPRPPSMVLGGRALVSANAAASFEGSGPAVDPGSSEVLHCDPGSRPSTVESSRFIPQSVLSAHFQLITAEVPRTILADPNCLIDVWTPGATTCSIIGSNEAFGHSELTLELQPAEPVVDETAAAAALDSSSNQKKKKKKKKKKKSVEKPEHPKARRFQPIHTNECPEEVEPETAKTCPWFFATGTKAVSDLSHLRCAFPARSKWYEMHSQDESTMYFEAHVQQLDVCGHLLIGLAGPGVKLHESAPVKPGGGREPTGEASVEQMHELQANTSEQVDADAVAKTRGNTSREVTKSSVKPMKFAGKPREANSYPKRSGARAVKEVSKGLQPTAAPSPIGPAVWSYGAGGGVRCTEPHTIGRWGWEGGEMEEMSSRGRWRGKTRTASDILPGDVIGVAVWRDQVYDPPLAEVEFSKNGDPISGVVRMQLASDVPLFPVFSGIGARVYVNFGRRPLFEFPPPRLVQVIPRPLAPPAEIEEPPGESEEDKQKRLQQERLKEARRRADEARQASKAKAMDFRKKKVPSKGRNKKASPAKKKPAVRNSSTTKKVSATGRKRSSSP